jgi:hypothetical protein
MALALVLKRTSILPGSNILTPLPSRGMVILQHLGSSGGRMLYGLEPPMLCDQGFIELRCQ